jgi:hypothetical protein
MMRGDDDLRAHRQGLRRQQIVTRLARALLNARARLRTLPAQNAMRYAEPRGEPCDFGRLCFAFRSQSVIDGRGVQTRAAPFGGHQQQRGGIGATGDGEQQRGLARQNVERRTDHVQRSVALSRSADFFTDAGAVG